MEEFQLWKKLPFLLIIATLIYFVVFKSFINITFNILPRPAPITYSVTDFWKESKPFPTMVKIAQYNTSISIDIYNIESLRQKYIEEYKLKFPERYRSHIGWLNDSFRNLNQYYKISIIYFLLLIPLSIKQYRAKKVKGFLAFLRIGLLMLLTFFVIIVLRYNSEQTIEQKFIAENRFVITNLYYDIDKDKQKLDDTSLSLLKQNIYKNFEKHGDRSYLKYHIFWLSRMLESLEIMNFVGINRKIKYVSTEDFIKKYDKYPEREYLFDF